MKRAAKQKLSATVEPQLLEFLDSIQGETRSQKLESVLRWFKRFEEERRLRKELASADKVDEDRIDRDAWERTIAEAMWTE